MKSEGGLGVTAADEPTSAVIIISWSASTPSQINQYFSFIVSRSTEVTNKIIKLINQINRAILIYVDRYICGLIVCVPSHLPPSSTHTRETGFKQVPHRHFVSNTDMLSVPRFVVPSFTVAFILCIVVLQYFVNKLYLPGTGTNSLTLWRNVNV